MLSLVVSLSSLYLLENSNKRDNNLSSRRSHARMHKHMHSYMYYIPMFPFRPMPPLQLDQLFSINVCLLKRTRSCPFRLSSYSRIMQDALFLFLSALYCFLTWMSLLHISLRTRKSQNLWLVFWDLSH